MTRTRTYPVSPCSKRESNGTDYFANLKRVPSCYSVAVYMVTYERQKEKVSNYLAFDSSKPSGLCVKSKIITQEHEFFCKFLLLTLGLIARHTSVESKIITHISTDLHRTFGIFEELEMFDNKLELLCNFPLLTLESREA